MGLLYCSLLVVVARAAGIVARAYSLHMVHAWERVGYPAKVGCHV
jgi:hypothetical protein